MARGIAAIVERYSDDVISGRIAVGKLERLAVERQYNDLASARDRGFWFDEDAAAHAVDFFGFLKHSKGEWAGQPFRLEPWQVWSIWTLFGWRQESDGNRRFRIAFESMARKNGKSQKAAGVGLYLFVADGEAGAEVYTAATKLDQARIVHSEAQRMVRRSPELGKLVDVFKSNLSIRLTSSKYEPLGADAKTMDGLNPHGCIIDELHAHPNREMWDVLETATSARRQSLIFAITTAGHDLATICGEIDDYAMKILDGTLIDDSFFAFICRIDADDVSNWADSSLWRKANPNLGVCCKQDDLQRKADKAQKQPSFQNPFLRLHLNCWTEQINRFVDMPRWRSCADPAITLDTFQGRKSYAGLDLANKYDVNAFVILAPDGEQGYTALPLFWVPEQVAQELLSYPRRGGGQYWDWAQQGYIELTPGDVTDYQLIQERIRQIAGILKNDIEIAVDPYNATQMMINLEHEGVNVVEFSQTMRNFNEPTKELDLLLHAKSANRLRHNGNKCMDWMASNCAVKEDSSGNLRPVKPGREDVRKVDGMTALIMALGRSITAERESNYAPRLIILD